MYKLFSTKKIFIFYKKIIKQTSGRVRGSRMKMFPTVKAKKCVKKRRKTMTERQRRRWMESRLVRDIKKMKNSTHAIIPAQPMKTMIRDVVLNEVNTDVGGYVIGTDNKTAVLSKPVVPRVKMSVYPLVQGVLERTILDVLMDAEYERLNSKPVTKKVMNRHVRSAIKRLSVVRLEDVVSGEVAESVKSSYEKKLRHKSHVPKPTLKRPQMKRLTQRAGIRKFNYSSNMNLMRSFVKEFIKVIMQDAFEYMHYEDRVTIYTTDVARALRRHGMQAYGFKDTE